MAIEDGDWTLMLESYIPWSSWGHQLSIPSLCKSMNSLREIYFTACLIIFIVDWTQDGRRYTRLQRLPPVLRLQPKRFAYDADSSTIVKVHAACLPGFVFDGGIKKLTITIYVGAILFFCCGLRENHQ